MNYNRDIETIIPSVFIHEDISETKYDLMAYYGGSITEILTSVLALALDDIRNTRFKAWWPNDEEILLHYDKYMSHVHNGLYNAWAIKSTSGNDMRRIEWDVLESIYRPLIARLWRRFINVAWQTVAYCYQVAFSETGNQTNLFNVSLVGIAVDDSNGFFFARFNIQEL
jgi:hypothetical protein